MQKLRTILTAIAVGTAPLALLVIETAGWRFH